EALGAQLRSDSVVLGQAQKLQNAMRDRDIQKGVCDDMKKTVETTQQAVAAAQQKLTELQQSVHSDVARAEATKALSGAAQVLDTFKGLNGAGAALAREHGRVNEEYEQAKARLED